MVKRRWHRRLDFLFTEEVYKGMYAASQKLLGTTSPNSSKGTILNVLGTASTDLPAVVTATVPGTFLQNEYFAPASQRSRKSLPRKAQRR